MTFGLNSPLRIAGLTGDSHGALFGQHCFSAGMTKATYGTGIINNMNIGKIPKKRPAGLVTSIGLAMINQLIMYLREIFIAQAIHKLAGK